MPTKIQLVESLIRKIMLEQTGNIKADVQKYLDKLTDYHTKEWKRLSGNDMFIPTFEATFGKTWIKVIRKGMSSRSSFCFIDMNGDLYKAAGWNAPAKGKRGSIYDAKPPLDGADFYR